MVDRLLDSLAILTAAFSAAFMLIVVLREPCRKLAGSAFSYWIWLLAPVAMLAAVLPALPHAAPAPSLPLMQSVSHSLNGQVAVQPQALSLAELVLSVWRGLTVYLLGAWGFGLIAFLCRIALMQRRFIGGLGRLTRDPSRANVFYSEKTGVSPSVIGLLRSRIVLPADFAELYGQDEQTLIMAHERTHVRERHPTAGALGVLIVAVQWFNPLAYMALSLLRIDQELACDAAVVTAHPNARAAYAKAMLKARIGVDVSPPLAYCWVSRLSLPMKDRIGLLKVAPPTPRRRATATAMLALIASGSAVAAYAVVPHPEISLNWAQAPVRAEPRLIPSVASVPAESVKAVSPQGQAVTSLPATSPAVESSSISVTSNVLTNVTGSSVAAEEDDTALLSERGRRLFYALSEAVARGENIAPPQILTTTINGQTVHNVRMAPSGRDPYNFDDLNNVINSIS